MEEDRCLNNWDLDAVVRLACQRRLSPPPRPQVNDPFHSFPPLPPQQGPPAALNPANEQEADAGWCFPDLRAGRGQDGDDLLGALLAAQPPMPPPALPTPPPPATQQQPVTVTPAEVPAPAPAAPASAPPARAQPRGRQMPGAAVPRSKRRKNQVKKVVCHVPADGSSSSDVWAWRKYGQKPIKGSPYPRGYYRCSSSKGCAARKQVERCRTDPNTFILTYTGEHNHAAPTHRNSLAGTTRYKFPSTASPPPPSVVVGSSESQQQQPTPSAPSTSAGLSPTTPLRTPSMEDDEEEEEDELLVEDMEMAGEDELLFLNGDAADSAAPMETLFDVVDEPFLGSLWASTTAGSPAAVAAGAGS